MKRNWLGWLAATGAVITLVIGVFSGCVAERKEAKIGKDGVKYGVTRGNFRHRWWNYEERGRSYSNGTYYDEAIEDFQEALKQRPADTKRARTYGMHMVRYFPHRELGIAYLKRGKPGDLELAMKELKISLAQAPTVKASYYLHETYKTWVRDSNRDKRPPNIDLAEAPKNGAASVRYRLSGKLDDDLFLDRLMINDREVDLPKAKQDYEFSEYVELGQDVNSFRVTALDLAGKKKVRVISVSQDITGPMVSVKSPRIGSTVATETVTLKGMIVDPAGLKDLSIAGTSVELDRTKTISPFTATIKLEKGRNLVRFRAIDQAGNVTIGRLPFRYTEEPAVAYLPQLDEQDEGIFWEDTFRGGGVFGPANGAPNIEVMNLKTGQIVPLRPNDVDKENGGSYVLQVAVAAETIISAITVNGRDVKVPEMENLFFTQRVPMDEGDVTIAIQAKDKNGRDGTSTLKVKAEVPKTFDTQNRLTMAPLPFKNQVDESAKVKSMSLDGHLLKSFHDSKRFKLVDRSDDALKKFVEEQKLAQTDFVDKDKAIATGKLLNAEYLLIGAIVEDDQGAELLCKIVNTTTSEIVATPQVYGLIKTTAQRRKLAADLADNVIQELPMISGTVKVKGDKMAISKGENAGLKSRTQVIVFRPDPDFGDEAPPTEIAIAEVARVGKTLSFIQTVKMLEESGEIKDGDEFVTK